jgi:hypothetical protein
MQDHVKAARSRTTFASAGYDERRPCDNPTTTAYSPDWERCASVPGYRGQVMRYTFIHYVARNFHGHRLEGVAEGFHARIIQLEIHHWRYRESTGAAQSYRRQCDF